MIVISIIGKSGSGKTTLIERLIPVLKDLNYRVGTVKHDAHNFEVDKVGKDSWRHKNAGAAITLVSSAKKVAIFTDTEEGETLESLCGKYINGIDIVLTEGFRMSIYPKIEVNRTGNCNDLLCGTENNLLAIVSDYEFDRGVPVIKPDNIAEIAAIIVNLIKNK